MKEMLLDRVGDAPVPDGYQLIDSEVSFLHWAIEETPMLVRGFRLCQWAETFWKGRCLPYREHPSPTRALQQIAPTLNTSQAQAICSKLPDDLLSQLYKLSLTEFLQALFPNALWEQRPSKEHAADWLLWLHEYAPTNDFEPLLAQQTYSWQLSIDNDTYKIYTATNATTATKWLHIWLGVTPSNMLNELEMFPRELPPTLKKDVIKKWKDQIITQHGDLITQLQARPILPDLIRTVAKEIVTYFEHNPNQLNKSLRDQLFPYLISADQSRLLRLMPPPMPDNPPNQPEAVLDWFRNQYLPARQWQSSFGSDREAHQIRVVAEQFTHWYLEQYPRALNGGVAQKHLSFFRTAAIEQQDTYITLLIVLDGLHLLDAQQLLGQLKGRTNRLTVWDDGLAFAPLPTITDICKPALFAGVKPELAEATSPLGTIVPNNRSPIELLNKALPGELYLWRVAEPDASYHSYNSSDNLLQEIEGRLVGVASKISNLVGEVPAVLPLRLIITSDHGRLLAKATRNLDVPTGMQSHGRAAISNSNRQFDERGFAIEDGIIYLHGGRFGLPSDAAMAFTGDTFRTNDNRTGTEWYPHGGAYPEEVIVPWVELVRDMNLPEVTAQLSGTGKAGQPGELTLYIHNSGELPLKAITLTVAFGKKPTIQSLDITILPLSKEPYKIALSVWPTKAELDKLSAQLTLQLPNKLTFPISINEIELESEEMYRRDDILGDLDL